MSIIERTDNFPLFIWQVVGYDTGNAEYSVDSRPRVGLHELKDQKKIAAKIRKYYEA